jgi:hypothetical protein
MYLRAARLKDVKCFDEVELRLQSAAETGDRQSNWNVILGQNGDGKTTLLQSIAACLMDATTADRMLRPTGWVRGKEKFATLAATIVPREMDRGPAGADVREMGYAIVAPTTSGHVATTTLMAPDRAGAEIFGARTALLQRDVEMLAMSAFTRRGSQGWLGAGYGPHRRPAGSSEPLPSKDPLERRFGTLFDERQPLYDCEGWLKELDRRAMKAGKTSVRQRVLEDAKKALQRLLPDVEEILVEDEVSFVWNGGRANLDQLSQGYRSMFVLAVDLLRWMEEARSTTRVPLTEVQGVVLIDEVDAHLHPEWQRKVGFTLCETFPNLQFIVASHSPFVAMAAGPGGLTLLQREDDRVRARQDVPYVRGWAVDEVLEQLFGLDSLRDPETEKKLADYERLRTLERSDKLGPQQAKTLAKLRTYLDKRLSGEPESPRNKRIDEDLTRMSAALAERRKKHA